MKKILSLIIVTMLVFSLSVNIFAATDNTVTFYVDAAASEGGDGSADRPFKTLTEAKDAVKKYAASSSGDEKIDIVFAEGIYRISKTVSFFKADSGFAGFPVTYKAADGAAVVFTGASVGDGSSTPSVHTGILINISGASHLRFEGITFSDSLNAPQIHINGNDIAFDKCTVSNTGYTIKPSDTSKYFAILGNGKNISVTNCEIYNTYGGVSLSGGDRKTLTSGNNVINSNYIHDVSKSAVSVSGVGAEVSHNEIAQCNGSGIVFSGNDHVIEYNVIRNSCITDGYGACASDGGVTSYGNEIRYNFIDKSSADGISLQGGLSGAAVYGNIIKNASRGIYLGGGRDLAVENNIVINDSDEVSADAAAIYYDSSVRDSAVSSSESYAALAAEFSDLPYSSGVWAASYPSLAKVNVPPSLSDITDKHDSSLFFNPAGSIVRNNAFYAEGEVKSLTLTINGSKVNGVTYQQRWGNVFNNVLLPRGSTADFPAAEFENYALTGSAAVFKALKDFKDIPFNKMGIIGVTSKMTFKDVKPSAWYYKWVLYAVTHGLMNGTDTSGGAFSPSVATSRAMIVQTLYNIEGKPEVEYKDIFSDVKKKAWYADAVIWAAENGITAGISETEFAPDDLVTREQAAVFLYRYMRDYKGAELSEGASLSEFPDADGISAYEDFTEAISWAIGEGVMTGKADAGKVYLAPKDSAQRCEAAAIFGRFWMEFVY